MKTLGNVSFIVIGVVIASFGEIKFHLLGFLFQIGGITFEAIRLVMVQRLLSSSEFKMDPLVSLYYFAPICAVMNGVVALIWEVPRCSMEDVYNVGGDLSYRVPGSRNLTISAGGAYLDTPRGSTRRDFSFRPASALPLGVTEQRPDYLLSDFNVYNYNILLVETSGLAGTARYQGDLQVAASLLELPSVLPAVTLQPPVDAGMLMQVGR